MISSCLLDAVFCLLVCSKKTSIEHQLAEGLDHYSSDDGCHLPDYGLLEEGRNLILTAAQDPLEQ